MDIGKIIHLRPAKPLDPAPDMGAAPVNREFMHAGEFWHEELACTNQDAPCAIEYIATTKCS